MRFPLRLPNLFSLPMACLAVAVGMSAVPSPAQMRVENLNRGVVALRANATQVHVSWRYLGPDPDSIAFHVFRSIGGGAPVQLTPSPLTNTTDFRDTPPGFTSSLAYHVRPVLNGEIGAASESWVLPANAPNQPFFSVPLTPPPEGVTPTGETYTYSANDAAPADLDGDGTLDIVLKWEPSNSKDNSQSGYTGEVYLDGLRLDGTRLWRVNLGRNIRAGAHYTQFIAYDFDSDGRAEVAVKTAPGTIDGTGQSVLLPGDNADADFRNGSGYVLSGPEYLTIFNGINGAALATTSYNPPRGSVSSWGDSYGNRVDRFLAGVAYLDGERPSLIMCRGYYTKTHIVAWDWRDRQLTQRWHFFADNGTAYAGQGNHQLSVADVDADGKQEIIYGSMAVDDHGSGLYSTGLGHGDALHVSDFDPNRPGLEVFAIHEDMGSSGNRGATFRDAATGTILWSTPATGDTGRGVTMDIDPVSPGAEAWASNDGNIYSATGSILGPKPSNTHQNFGVWWDADPSRETLDGTVISNIHPTTYNRSNILQAWEFGATQNNGTKANPALSGDFLGDWREEVIWRNTDSSALLIFVPITSATNRLRTFLHDPQYRVALAWQNVAYNQPPHPSFFVGGGMSPPPAPNITTETIPLPRLPGEIVWTGLGSPTWDTTTANFRLPDGTSPITFLNGDHTRFDDSSPGGAVSLSGELLPASVVVDSTIARSFTGSGFLAGPMTLTKRGAGSLIISTAQSHSGGTQLEAGTLAIGHAGALGSGSVTLRGGTLATGTLAPANSLVAEEPSTITGGASNGAHAVRAITGDAPLSLIATNVFDFEGSLAGYTGTLTLGGSGSFRFFGSAGSSQAAFDLGTRTLGARSGTTFSLGSLTGAPGSTLNGATGGGNNSAVIYTIGANHLNTTFAGAITNGNNTNSIVKTGNGRLLLTGTSTYTGATQVQSGRLVITGSLGTTSVSVSSGALLGGPGTLGGNVSFAANARLGLALSSASFRGPSIAGSVTLQGPLIVEIEDLGGTLAAGTHLLLEHGGTLTANAQFVWSPPPGSPLVATFPRETNRVWISLVDPRPGIVQWTEQRFGPGAPPASSDPLADPDGNGLANVLEYALGLPPQAPASSVLRPTAARVADRLTLSFQRVADPLLVYTVEAGNSPANLAPIWTSTGPANAAGWTTVEDVPDATGAAVRFMRLRVSMPSP